jgi:exosortase/archaeosortase family protein
MSVASRNSRKASPKAGSSRPWRKLPGTIRRWYAGKAPILHFGARFCVLLVFLHLFLLAPFCKRVVRDATVLDAGISGAVLNLLGQHNQVKDSTLLSGDSSIVTVLPACSCDQILCFFIAAVAAFPMPFAKKLAGAFVGSAAILGLNLVRIINLYWIGVHYPRVFSIAHEEIWALLFTIAPVALYIAWIRWASRPAYPAANVTA